MGGGGGGGSSYDDQWIKDWHKDAEKKYTNTSAYIKGLQHVHKNYTKPEIERLTGESTEAYRRLDELGDWNADRIKEISGLSGNLSSLTGDVSGLSTKLSDLETAFGNRTTDVGDVTGLEDIISGLQEQYSSADTAIGTLQSDLSTGLSNLATDTKTQLDEAIEGLGISDYLKTSDFNTRMDENLGALSDTLTEKFGEDIAALDLPAVRDAIAAAEGNIGSLSEDFAGLSSDMDWIKKLDLEGFDDRLSEQGETIRDEFKGDLTDLQDILESGRGEALANLETQLGKDRAADILQLKEDIESGRASDIETLAGNLRQEYGDDLFDLSNTFDERLAGVQSELGGSIEDLFGDTGELKSGLSALTSDLGTTSQQLGALSESFGDYKTQAATNLGDVKSAFQKEIGDLSGSLTSGLSDLKSDYTDRILGESQARQSGLAEAAQARSDLGTALRGEASSALQDVYKTREQAISDLSGRFGENLRAQEESLGRRIDETSKAVDEKIGRLGSMMNYRMLGDSAGGVKMRRSKAYKSGAVNTGTGQLSRSMKLKTLNI